MSTITLGTVRTPSRRAPARTESAPWPSAHLRLTRRGKIVILALAVVAIAILAVVLGPSSTATDEAGQRRHPRDRRSDRRAERPPERLRPADGVGDRGARLRVARYAWRVDHQVASTRTMKPR
jgi:hypothetical protein